MARATWIARPVRTELWKWYSIANAIELVPMIGRHTLSRIRSAHHLCMLAHCQQGLLLVATTTKQTARYPSLQEHIVYTVTQSEWISIPLLQPLHVFPMVPANGLPSDGSPDQAATDEAPSSTSTEDEGYSWLPRYKATAKRLKLTRLDNTHYFCSSLDLTNFWVTSSGAAMQVSDGFTALHCTALHCVVIVLQQLLICPRAPCSCASCTNAPLCPTASQATPRSGTWDAAAPEFVWNDHLMQPFRDAGVPDVCPVLLRGMCCSWDLPQGTVCTYVVRQSNVSPGTRYLARGLGAHDGCVAAGNEYECEHVVWRAKEGAPAGTWLWAHYAWRRGSVPIAWTSVIKPHGEVDRLLCAACSLQMRATDRCEWGRGEGDLQSANFCKFQWRSLDTDLTGPAGHGGGGACLSGQTPPPPPPPPTHPHQRQRMRNERLGPAAPGTFL